MELNDYQKSAMTTCMSSSENFSYMFLNLVGEVGELASKVSKGIRKGHISLDGNNLRFEEFPTCIDMDQDMMYEAGDILWQLSGLCSVMGWDLERIARMNLDKLAARKAIGTIDGNGDGIERSK